MDFVGGRAYGIIAGLEPFKPARESQPSGLRSPLCVLHARQRCLSARRRLERMKRAKGSRKRRRAGLIWRRGSGSAWKSIAPDTTKTSGQKIPGAKQCGERQQGYGAETSNNFVTALTKPAPRSVCSRATGPPEVGLALIFVNKTPRAFLTSNLSSGICIGGSFMIVGVPERAFPESGACAGARRHSESN